MTRRKTVMSAVAAVAALTVTAVGVPSAAAGTRTTQNACMWPDGNRRAVNLTLEGEATPTEPTSGTTVTLAGARVSGSLPDWVADEAYGYGVIALGTNVLPVTVEVRIAATNTAEGSRVLTATETLTFDYDPDEAPPILSIDAPLAASTWTSTGGRIDFTQSRADIKGTVEGITATFFADCRAGLFNVSFDPTFTTPVPFESVATGDVSFSDVPESHPFHANVHDLVEAGIAAGYDDGTFRPGTVVSRQAVASFLYKMAGSPTFQLPAVPTFGDVGNGHPFQVAIEWAAGQGIVTGYGDGTFRPTAPVSRQASAAFLYRYVGSPAVTGAGTSFEDVGPTHPFATPIEWMADSEVAGGYEDGTFKPGADVTRQAVAAFITRLPG